MGSRTSKPAEPEQPQLYAVATPHPTLQYIYPVYASPIDLSKAASMEKKGRSSPLTWRSDKSKGKKEVQIINEHTEHLQQEPPVGINDDGAWYHFHVGADGDVDYIRPGTTLPTAFQKNQAIYPSYTVEESIVPSRAGTPYQDSYYSYSSAPGYQAFHHPQPQRPSQSDAYSSGTPYPRARSVSPVHSRAMTPTNRPRRATTPTPKGSRTPVYEPAPPMPQEIVLLPRRIPPSSFNAKSLPSSPGSGGADLREYSRAQAIEYRSSERRADRRERSPDYSRTAGSRTLGSHRPSLDEDTTAVSSPYHGSSRAMVVKPTNPRPYSPRSEHDDEEEEEEEQRYAYHHSRSPNKHARDYPSPSSITSDRRVQTRRY